MSSIARKLFQRKPSQVKLQNNKLPIPELPTAPATTIPSLPNPSTEKLSSTLLVVGAPGVGKTALVVRFLANRFLPEYDGQSDKSYSKAVRIEEKLLDLKILDKVGKLAPELVSSLTDLDLDTVDGLIIVFSCSESKTFDVCLDLLDYFKFESKATLTKPTLVIGNKTDLDHLREVGFLEAERCVLKYPGCAYEECSAAAQNDDVEVIFRSFIKQTLVKKDKREIQRNGRKSSISDVGSPKQIRANFRRRFSMFGRDRTGSG